MNWRHSGSPRRKKFRVQKSAGKVLASFFLGGGIKTESSSLIIFWRTHLSTRSIIHICWCNWRQFWRKNSMGKSPRWSFSCTTVPRPTGQFQPRRNLPTWASSVFITLFIIRIWTHLTTTCSLYWNNNWNVAIFLRTRRSLLPRKPGWTDNILIFLIGLKN